MHNSGSTLSSPFFSILSLPILHTLCLNAMASPQTPRTSLRQRGRVAAQQLNEASNRKDNEAPSPLFLLSVSSCSGDSRTNLNSYRNNE